MPEIEFDGRKDELLVAEYSRKQGVFHVDPIRKSLQTNAVAVATQRPVGQAKR